MYMSKWKDGIANLFSKGKDIKIGYKYIIIFAFTSLLFIVAIGIAYFQMTIAEKYTKLIEGARHRAKEMARLAILIQTKEVKFGDYIRTEEAESITAIESLNKKIDKLISELKPKLNTAEQKALFTGIEENDKR